MNDDHICSYCGLNCYPLAYHEGHNDCQAASRYLAEKLRALLVFDPHDYATKDLRLWEELSKLVGLTEGTDPAKAVGFVKDEYDRETFS